MEVQSNINQNQNKCSLCKGLGMVNQHNGQFIKCPACFKKEIKANPTTTVSSDTKAKKIIGNNLKDIEIEIDEKLKLLKVEKEKEKKKKKKNK